MSTVDQTALRRILNQDPAWTAYALADLQPAYAPYCQWVVATAANPVEEGVLLLFTALTPPILLTVGGADVVATLLARAGLPEQVFISARLAHLPLIEQYYRFDQSVQGTSLHRMARMVFRNPQPLVTETLGGVSRLGPADASQITALIAHGGAYAPDAFEPYQLDEGVFFGVHGAGGDLLAVGGTHIVDWTAGIGAVGNMYTHPAHRGHGYARAVLGAIVKTLQEGGVDTIILNVNTQNQTARRIYEAYGFVVHCEFVEGIGVRHELTK